MCRVLEQISHLNPEETFQQLERFALEGDKLIKGQPEIIDLLKENRLISYMPTEISSISALLEGKPSSVVVDHYVWTSLGNHAYRELQKKYS